MEGGALKITDDNGYIVFDENKLVSFKVNDSALHHSIEVNIDGSPMMTILNYKLSIDLNEAANGLKEIISKRDK